MSRFEDNTTCFNTVTFDTCNADYDTKIQVWDDASCTGGAPTCVTGNDDSCGTQSRAVVESDAARRYYVWVSGHAGNSGKFTLNVECTWTTWLKAKYTRTVLKEWVLYSSLQYIAASFMLQSFYLHARFQTHFLLWNALFHFCVQIYWSSTIHFIYTNVSNLTFFCVQKYLRVSGTHFLCCETHIFFCACKYTYLVLFVYLNEQNRWQNLYIDRTNKYFFWKIIFLKKS